MNARVAAHRAGYRRPRRYAVPTYDPDRDARWGRFVFGDCRPVVLVDAISTRPQDWAPAARAILLARGAWRGRA